MRRFVDPDGVVHISASGSLTGERPLVCEFPPGSGIRVKWFRADLTVSKAQVSCVECIAWHKEKHGEAD